MRFLPAFILMVSACSSDRRVYVPPVKNTAWSQATSAGAHQSFHVPRYERGEVLRFTYAESPGAGQVTAGYVGSMLVGSILPISSGPNNSHIPTYHIRLDSGRIVHVRDPGSLPLARGSRVVLLPEGATYRIMPDRPQR
jgi:hypothetical protein